MANVLTAVAPALFSEGRIVPRERVGFVQSVTTDFNDMGAAKGDTVKITVAPVMTTGTYTPAQTFTAGSDSTPTTLSLVLNQQKEVTWNLTAEEERSIMNSGVAQDFAAQRIKQACRVAANEIEAYCGTLADVSASRAHGTAGTAPFGTAANLTDSAGVRRILVDNGAAMDGMSLILDSAAGANVCGVQSSLFKANEAGSSDLLRNGVLGRIHGFDLRESAGVASHVKGTGASYTTNTAGYAVGATSITLITGTGTILAGDVITFTGDTNKYVVKTALTAGVVVIQEPGLKVALAGSAVALTVGNAATSNIALHKSAIALVARPAIQPVAAGIEQMVITDDVSKLSFLLLRVVGSGMSSWYLRFVYDAFAANPYAMAKLLG